MQTWECEQLETRYISNVCVNMDMLQYARIIQKLGFPAQFKVCASSILNTLGCSIWSAFWVSVSIYWISIWAIISKFLFNVVTFSYLLGIFTYCTLSIWTTWFLTGLSSVFNSCCFLSIYRYYLIWNLYEPIVYIPRGFSRQFSYQMWLSF